MDEFERKNLVCLSIQNRDGDYGVLRIYRDGTASWYPRSFQMAPVEVISYLRDQGYTQNIYDRTYPMDEDLDGTDDND